MDKNTLVGFALIGALIIGFNWLSQPSAEELAERQKHEQLLSQNEEKSKQTTPQKELVRQGTTEPNLEEISDLPEYKQTRELVKSKLENSKLLIRFNSLGAYPEYAEIKGYTNHKDGYDTTNKKPVCLFRGQDNYFNLPLKLKTGEILNTADCYFIPLLQTDSTNVLRLPFNSDAYLDFTYKLNKDDYRLDFTISGKGLEGILSSEEQQNMEWQLKLPQQEQSHRFEAQYSSLYYGKKNGDVNDLSTNSSDKESVEEPLRWFAFKDKYFSSVLINKQGTFQGGEMRIEVMDETSGYIRSMAMHSSFAYSPERVNNFTYFFGPNDYNILKSYDDGVEQLEQLNLDHLVYLGWSIFRSINRWLIIPIVDFLKDYIGSWGIIILLLTIFIKTILFPFTYKSQISQVKMRILKPQVDEINKKYEGKTDQDTMLKKQKETMALYSSVGASPMSGCLPMLLQMPFLIALYMYFPTSIYLRGQGFLWAEDLSTYDPVISWDFNIPIIGALLGNHISLFCLLMTTVNIVYNKYMMSQSSASAGNDAMAGMKYMPYMMSVMFFFMFNQNASGLSYYYFISTLITIIQFFIIRATINEDKLLQQMEENKRKPKKRTGGNLMERLERMQREQMASQRKALKR